MFDLNCDSNGICELVREYENGLQQLAIICADVFECSREIAHGRTIEYNNARMAFVYMSDKKQYPINDVSRIIQRSVANTEYYIKPRAYEKMRNDSDFQSKIAIIATCLRADEH